MRMKPHVANILGNLSPLKSNQDTPEVGELEPSLEILELLLSQAAVAADLPHFLNDEPLTSLMNYEFEDPKPELIPPTPQPKAQAPSSKKRSTKKGKNGRDYAAERARRSVRLQKEVEDRASQTAPRRSS